MDTERVDAEPKPPEPQRIFGLTIGQLKLLAIGVAMMAPPVVFVIIIFFVLVSGTRP